MGAWQEIADVTVATTVNEITIDLSATPIQKGEFWKIDYQMTSPSANIGYGLYFNGNTTATNYYYQVFQVTGTSITAFRGNDSYVSDNNNQTYSTQPVYIVLAENGTGNYFTNKFTNIGTPSNSVGGFHYNTTTFTMSSITSLTLQSRTANQVGAGSRIQIYKLAAEKVADITTTVNATQVNIPIPQSYDLVFSDNNGYGFSDGVFFSNSGYATTQKQPLINDTLIISDVSKVSHICFWNEDTFIGQFGRISSQIDSIDNYYVPENATHFALVASKDPSTGWTYANIPFSTFSTVSAAYVADDTTSLDKDSEYLLVSDISNANNQSNYHLTPNDVTTLTNYYYQAIFGSGSLAGASRENSSRIAFVSSSTNKTMAYTHIKLSNIGAYTHQSYNIFNYGGTDVGLSNNFASSTAENITSITKLNIVSDVTNNIAAGSTFTLYKLY